jgi:hypothetical protein
MTCSPLAVVVKSVVLLVSLAGLSLTRSTTAEDDTGPLAEVACLALDPHTPTTLYAGTATGVFKSTNSGRGWHATNVGIELGDLCETWVVNLLVDPETPTRLYFAAADKGVLTSQDGGRTWGGYGVPLNAFSLALAPDGRTLYVGTASDGVAKSTDGGQTWVHLGPPKVMVFQVSVVPKTPTTLYAWGSTATHHALLFKSDNGGADWTPTSLTDSRVGFLVLDPLTPTTQPCKGPLITLAERGCARWKHGNGACH